MLAGTISQLLGERVSVDLSKEIKGTVTSFPEVLGAYDLILNNYGPDTFNGSIHIEVPMVRDLAQQADIDAIQESDEPLSEGRTPEAVAKDHTILAKGLSYEWFTIREGFSFYQEGLDKAACRRHPRKKEKGGSAFLF